MAESSTSQSISHLSPELRKSKTRSNKFSQDSGKMSISEELKTPVRAIASP
jgi:hypothetical protein